MGVLMINCPVKDKPISTGIEVTTEGLHKLPKVRTFTQCRRCGLAHGWMIEDAMLVEDEAPLLVD